jgi:hypothetical protein
VEEVRAGRRNDPLPAADELNRPGARESGGGGPVLGDVGAPRLDIDPPTGGWVGMAEGLRCDEETSMSCSGALARGGDCAARERASVRRAGNPRMRRLIPQGSSTRDSR